MYKEIDTGKGVTVSINDTTFREARNRAQREQMKRLEKYSVYQLPIAT